MSIWAQNTILGVSLAAFALLFRAYSRTERWQRAWMRLRRNRLGMISLAVVSIYLLVAAMESVALPASSSTTGQRTALDWLFQNVPREHGYSAPLARTTFETNKPEPLTGRHLLGTDLLGRDVLVQTMKGCRTALIIGGLTSLIYIPIGALLGITAGYYRRWVDDIIQYIYSTVASIPDILLLIAILMILGRGLDRMAFALSVTAWVGLCRLVRGETFRQAAKPYVEAARALGESNGRIIVFHILPNVMHLVVINFVLGFSGLVLAEAILSYLGVGAPVGTASWGAMIDSARMELSREPVVWWNLGAATGAVFGLVLSLNLFGDALRRAFDPKAV